jgi:hypothetical protein
MGNFVDGICVRGDTEKPQCPKLNEHGTCTVYVRPDLANRARHAGCPFNQPVSEKVKAKINPLKASKRAKKGK